MLYYQDVLKNGEIEIPDDYFTADAKQLIDMLFDKKLLNPELTRDDLNAIQALVDLYMKHKLRSELSTRKLLQTISFLKNTHN
jgi:hypothetical protein